MKNAFRTLIAAQLLLWLGASLSASSSFRGLQREFHIPTSLFYGSALFGYVGTTVVFYAMVLACLALLSFWNPTRHIYAVLVIGEMLLSSTRPMVVRSGLMDAFHGGDAVLTGLLLSMIYFSPIKDVFLKRETAPPPFPSEPAPPQWQPAPVAVAEPAPPPSPMPAPAPVTGRQVCASCGAGDQEGKFCTQCGKTVAAAVRRCVRCGTEEVPGEKFCRECGMTIA